MTRNKLPFYAALMGLLVFILTLTACGGNSILTPVENAGKAGNSARPATVGAPQWPMLHYDNRHTGRSPYLGPQSPAIKWTFQTTGQITGSSPAIATDGTVYIMSGDDTIWAVNNDGTLRWKYYLGGSSSSYQPASSPAIGPDGAVFAGSNTGKFFAFNPDGSVKWVNGQCPSAVYSAPTITDSGTLYWVCFGGAVVAANASTGATDWTATPYGGGHSSPAILPNGNIVVAHEVVFALSPAGATLWTSPYFPEVESSPAIADDGTIYVAAWDSNLHALNPDGSMKWQSSIGWYGRDTPAIAVDGTVYATSDAGNLNAFNPDGSLRWTLALDTPNLDTSWSGPIVDPNGTIYVGWGHVFNNTSGKFYAVNPDGTLKWTVKTGGSVLDSAAIAADGTLYFAAYDGKLYAIGEANQRPDTSRACATPNRLWPPNHKMRTITIGCVTDPDGDTVTITVTGITQDEPTNGLGDGDTSPDGILSPLQLRAERSGTGDGRVYGIDFTASDGQAETPGSVTVCVPHSVKSVCTDSRPPEYDSTQP